MSGHSKWSEIRRAKGAPERVGSWIKLPGLLQQAHVVADRPEQVARGLTEAECGTTFHKDAALMTVEPTRAERCPACQGAWLRSGQLA